MEAFVQQLINGISLGAIYALIALGYNLIFGVMNVFTFAHGTVVVMGAYAMLILTTKFGVDYYVAMAMGVIFAIVIGLIVERTTVRPIRDNGWAVVIATFGAAIVIENLMRHYKHVPALPVPFPVPFEARNFTVFGDVHISAIQIFLLLVGLVLMTGLVFFVYRTKMGMAIRAVAQSPYIAETLGINLNRVAVVCFIVASGVGGMVGILYAIYYQTIYIHVGSQFLGLKGLVVIVVAGAGNIPGSLAVGILLGVLEAFAIGYIDSSLRDFVAYTALLLVLIFRPSGLFGERAQVAFKV